MKHLQDFKEAMETLSSVADFLVVYILEAHPTDGWAIPNWPYRLPQHRQLADRLRAAATFKEDNAISCDFVVDLMDNSANKAFSAFPDRHVIIHNGIVSYASTFKPGVDKEPLTEIINNILN